jgi:hypothetical protein
VTRSLIATSLLILSLWIFAPSPGAPPQSAAAARVATGSAHDFSGVWKPGPSDLSPPPPMTPHAQAQFELNTQELKRDHPITLDPAYSCHPGMPRSYTYGTNPIEVVQTPGRIFIFYESAHLWRTVWMDGREMPRDSDPLWMGYSIGHWDGDDLVVNTANFNDRTWIDGRGHPHSEALKVTERFHRTDRNRLQISITIDDPKSYAAPWKTKRDYDLKPGWELGEAFCIPADESLWFKENIPEETKSNPANPK